MTDKKYFQVNVLPSFLYADWNCFLILLYLWWKVVKFTVKVSPVAIYFFFLQLLSWCLIKQGRLWKSGSYTECRSKGTHLWKHFPCWPIKVCSFKCIFLTALSLQCPLLCKDFIIDAWQLYYARSKGADAVLLIAGVLPDLDIKYMSKICKKLGLAALVEVRLCFLLCSQCNFIWLIFTL